jgi:hypothetical protein
MGVAKNAVFKGFVCYLGTLLAYLSPIPYAYANPVGGNGFADADLYPDRPITQRAVQFLVKRYAGELVLDAAVSVHSLRVTALTTARELGGGPENGVV